MKSESRLVTCYVRNEHQIKLCNRDFNVSKSRYSSSFDIFTRPPDGKVVPSILLKNGKRALNFTCPLISLKDLQYAPFQCVAKYQKVRTKKLSQRNNYN